MVMLRNTELADGARNRLRFAIMPVCGSGEHCALRENFTAHPRLSNHLATAVRLEKETFCFDR